MYLKTFKYGNFCWNSKVNWFKILFLKLMKKIILFLKLIHNFIFESFSGQSTNFKANLVCTETHMNVYISSPFEDFTGVIYTEGSYKVDGCHIAVDGSSKILFQIPYDSCKTFQVKFQFYCRKWFLNPRNEMKIFFFNLRKTGNLRMSSLSSITNELWPVTMPRLNWVAIRKISSNQKFKSPNHFLWHMNPGL